MLPARCRWVGIGAFSTICSWSCSGSVRSWSCPSRVTDLCKFCLVMLPTRCRAAPELGRREFRVNRCGNNAFWVSRRHARCHLIFRAQDRRLAFPANRRYRLFEMQGDPFPLKTGCHQDWPERACCWRWDYQDRQVRVFNQRGISQALNSINAITSAGKPIAVIVYNC